MSWSHTILYRFCIGSLSVGRAETHFTHAFWCKIQIRLKLNLLLSTFLECGNYKILHVTLYLCCDGICKLLKWSHAQELNNSPMIFPSNLNVEWKIFCEMGPWTSARLGDEWSMQWIVNVHLNRSAKINDNWPSRGWYLLFSWLLNIGGFYHGYLLNSLWPSDTIWRHRSGSPVAQVMAYCLMAPSHYLNQCWLAISEVLWRAPEGNFARDNLATNHWIY